MKLARHRRRTRRISRRGFFKTTIAAVSALALVNLAFADSATAPASLDWETGEVIALRKLTSKTYWLGGNTFRQVIGMKFKHYPLDVKAWEADPKHYVGGWGEIDPSFADDGYGGLESGPGFYRVTVDPTRPCAIVLDTIFGERIVTELTGLPLRHVQPEITEFGLIWRDISEDLDIELHTRGHNIEWYRRLKSGRAPKAWVWDVVTRFRVRHELAWNSIGWDNERGTAAPRFADAMFFRKHRRAQLVIEPTLLFESADVRHWRVAERWTGYVVEMTPGPRIWTITKDVEYPLYVDLVQNLNVTADNDDGGEDQYSNTWATLYNSYGNQSADPALGSRNPGWRLLDVTPATADTITAADLKITVESLGATAGVTSTVTIDDVDSAPAFGASNRPENDWHEPAATPVAFDQTSTGLKTLDMLTHMQEVQARGGWDAGGKDVRFCARGHSGAGVTLSYSGDREHTNSNETLFDLTYSTGGGGVTPRGTLLGVLP